MNLKSIDLGLIVSLQMLLLTVVLYALQIYELMEIYYFLNLDVLLIMVLTSFIFFSSKKFADNKIAKLVTFITIILLWGYFLIDHFMELGSLADYKIAYNILMIYSIVFLFLLNQKLFETIESRDESRYARNIGSALYEDRGKTDKSLRGLDKQTLFSISFIGIFVVFLAVQIYRLYTTGIGTDEGNFLYTIKQIFGGSKIYLDFWVRESGILVFLVPYFGFFDISIISLRFFALFVHLAIFFMYFFFMKEISNNNRKIIIILLVTSLALQFNGLFEFFPGIFYQVSHLLNVIVVFLLSRHFLNRGNNFYIPVMGFISGLAMLVYKGSQILVIITPTILILKNFGQAKRIAKDLTVFFFFAFIPLIIYWVYFALRTDFSHIFFTILIDLIINSAALYMVFMMSIPFMKWNILKKQINVNNLIILSNVFLVLILIYRFIEDPARLFTSFYSGLIFNYLFILMFVQVLNIYAVGYESKFSDRFKLGLCYLYIVMNLFFLFMGFGDRGFYKKIPEAYYWFSAVLFIAYNIFLFFYTRSLLEKRYRLNEWIFYFTLLINLWFFISAVGGPLMPTRFQAVMMFVPMMILVLTLVRTRLKYAIYLFISLSILFSIFTNVTLQNDFTFYSIDNLNDVVDYAEKNFKPGEVVFSTDTAILSEIENENIIHFYSPTMFFKPQGGYYYDGIEEKYGDYDISLRLNDTYQRIVDERPEYIIGTSRNTIKIFRRNETFAKLLKRDYVLEERNGRLYIYSHKDKDKKWWKKFED